MLDEYWSEALDQHHAFLQDDKHEIFFFPGSKGGYVFSYKDAQLKLTKAVSDPQIKRAIYLNDYLYMLGTNKVTVLSENDWQVVKELTLN